MISKSDILETIQMIDGQNLDVRTITCAINLCDCISDDVKRTCDKVYQKITSRAERLVEVGKELAAEYGIPIVNKRVSVTPIANIGASCRGYIQLARTLDRAAKTLGIDFIGGYSALVHKSMTEFEAEFLDTLPEALTVTDKVCASVNVASSKAGINMDAVRRLGEIILKTAYNTRGADGIGCAKLVVFCNSVEDNPFMAGAYSGFGEGDAV
ncbi:MAG: DUF711 family protein, partial [Clostridiales bacterium]|nr:DUF711 family protein [Clostridiales bacterium]